MIRHVTFGYLISLWARVCTGLIPRRDCWLPGKAAYVGIMV